MSAHPDVAGVRIMLLEDEPLVAMAIEDILLFDLGCVVLGPFLHLDDAFHCVRDRRAEIDIAILDINIRGERSFELAEWLDQLGIPFFFSTGYTEAGLDGRWRNRPSIGKWFSEARLARMIRQLVPEPPPVPTAKPDWQQILL